MISNPSHTSTQHIFQRNLTVVSINLTGFSDQKAKDISNLVGASGTNCDVVCLQETHRDRDQPKPYIPGFELAVDIPHPHYGSAILTRSGLQVNSIVSNNENSTEILTIVIDNLAITSFYKPPKQPFKFADMNCSDDNIRIVIGDFNCHIKEMGYKNTDSNGKKLERWAKDKNLTLMHNAELPGSFYSCLWEKWYNPDQLLVSANVSHACRKDIGPVIQKTNHRPLFCYYTAQSTDECSPKKRSRQG